MCTVTFHNLNRRIGDNCSYFLLLITLENWRRTIKSLWLTKKTATKFISLAITLDEKWPFVAEWICLLILFFLLVILFHFCISLLPLYKYRVSENSVIGDNAITSILSKEKGHRTSLRLKFNYLSPDANIVPSSYDFLALLIKQCLLFSIGINPYGYITRMLSLLSMVLSSQCSFCLKTECVHFYLCMDASGINVNILKRKVIK